MNARHDIDALFEVVDQEISYLAKSLQPTEEEKLEQAAFDQAYGLEDWLDRHWDEYEGIFLDPRRRYSLEDFMVDEDDPQSSVEKMRDAVPEAFDDFARWALDRMMGSGDSEQPPWLSMGFDRFVRDEWLVHFSDKASDIYREGFKFGVETWDYNRLALSTHFSEGGGGFNFAYLAHDAPRYGQGNQGWKYGKGIIMFQASGVLVTHYGDQEPQVIYLGRTAHNLVRLWQYNEEWCVGERPSGSPIFKHEKLKEVIQWVEANYDQYRKSLRAPREAPV